MSRSLLDTHIYRLIDAKLMTQGSVTTKEICLILDLSRQKVSRLFTKYQETCPNNMSHNLKLKRYVRGEDFKAHYLVSYDAQTYLDAISVVFHE